MTARRVIIAVGALLLLAGVIGLLVPVSVSDGNGGSVACGSGIASDLSAAKNANERNGANIPILNQVIPHTDFVAQCESSLSTRRSWSIPLTLVGRSGSAVRCWCDAPKRLASEPFQITRMRAVLRRACGKNRERPYSA